MKMKIFSSIIYAYILCNIITVINILHYCFLYVFKKSVINVKHKNNIERDIIHTNKSDVNFLFDINQYIYSTKKDTLSYLFDNNYINDAKKKKKKTAQVSLFSTYFFSLFVQKGVNIFLKNVFFYIYDYYQKIKKIILFLLCLKTKNKIKYYKNRFMLVSANNVINNDELHFPYPSDNNFVNVEVNKAINDQNNENELIKKLHSKYIITDIMSLTNEIWRKKKKADKSLNKYDGSQKKHLAKVLLHEQKEYKKITHKKETTSLNNNTYTYNILNRQKLIHNKYYLIKKIKNIKKKRYNDIYNTVSIIYISETKLKTEDDKTKSVINGIYSDKNEHVHVQCKNCMVRTKQPLYALKVKNDRSVIISSSSDIQVYYNYELMRCTNQNKQCGETYPCRYKTYPCYYKKRSNYGNYLIKYENRLTRYRKKKKKPTYELSRYYPKIQNYTLKNKLGKGNYGEIWYAINVKNNNLIKNVVLKKILINKDEETSEKNAMREVYFGELLKYCDNISRFIEYFKEYQIDENKEEHLYVWLVFANEGYALSSHLFDVNNEKNSFLVTPSLLWWSIKKQNIGMLVLKDIIKQILNGINIAHSKKITHRDLKMENIFLSATTPYSVRIGDWGSAVEYDNDNFMYIPTKDEETYGYQPPESLFGHMKNNYMRLPYYDMWCIGIIFLQFVLGTKYPLEVKNKRDENKIKNMYAKYSKSALNKTIFIQSLYELCLLPWSYSSNIIIPLHEYKHSNNSSSIYNNNIIINKLTHYIINNNNLLFIKKYISDFYINNYNLLMSIPASATCPDWGCISTYKHQSFPFINKDYFVNNIYSKGLSKINKFKNHLKHEQFLFQKKCTDEHFQSILQERDPSGVGLPNKNARNLLRRLLDFDYATRITAEEALNHPWFLEP
ncbi:serine/threonine protein kinase, putative [Hepatocystis sp. ex Piliocolobus tephrosceles]|nr:serine/threonine protein kinase, putative [Hepatocystis sp. ex Piliocolobus tephrosceles]